MFLWYFCTALNFWNRLQLYFFTTKLSHKAVPKSSESLLDRVLFNTIIDIWDIAKLCQIDLVENILLLPGISRPFCNLCNLIHQVSNYGRHPYSHWHAKRYFDVFSQLIHIFLKTSNVEHKICQKYKSFSKLGHLENVLLLDFKRYHRFVKHVTSCLSNSF